MLYGQDVSVTEFLRGEGDFFSSQRVCERDAEGMQTEAFGLFFQPGRMGAVKQVSEDRAAKSQTMGAVYAELVGASGVRI